jgi:hypothetical protein
MAGPMLRRYRDKYVEEAVASPELPLEVSA